MADYVVAFVVGLGAIALVVLAVWGCGRLIEFALRRTVDWRAVADDASIWIFKSLAAVVLVIGAVFICVLLGALLVDLLHIGHHA